MQQFSRFVGLDVHKDSIVVALAGAFGKPEVLGTVGYSARAVLKLLRKGGRTLDGMVACYEAGPTGYELQRELERLGLACRVVAPSLVPSLPGDKVKTDRRDALKLARFLRTGDLTNVFVPDERTEAIRDLERARADAKKAQLVARQQLSHFLLRHNRRYPKPSRWTKIHLEWIRQQRFEEAAHNVVLEEYLQAVELAGERVERLTVTIAEMVEGWHLEPLVKALQAFKGIKLLTAVIIAAELVDLRRFDSAPGLMSFLGLVPSERTTGKSARRGGITKTGNSQVRHVLVESAWSYRHGDRTSAALKKRRQGVSEDVCHIADQANKRLSRRYRRMQGRGKNKQVTVTAVARELAGFIWAVGQQDRLLA